jgi:hypothetical protein
MRNSIKVSMLMLNVLLSAMALSGLGVVDSQRVDASSYDSQFTVLNHQLYISITPSLYSYYCNLTHRIPSDSYYANMVTPQAVKPIAENLRNLTANLPNSDEQFANAVLALVHQIPYNVTGAKYPLETLVTNSGDCIGLSLLAASIMAAGGLDIILIHYVGINPGHINVGVCLPYTPAYHSFLFAPTSFGYQNKTYWAAEATGKLDWKVGDQSDAFAGAQALIIPLNNPNNQSNSLSACLDKPLLASSLTLSISQPPLNNENQTRGLLILGTIIPPHAAKNVTVFIYRNGELLDSLTNTTDRFGGFEMLWNFTLLGTYYIVASWSGALDYAGADSETLAVLVGPELLLQFQTPLYNYIFGRGIGAYELRPFVGVNDFLNVPLGQNVSLSCDFTLIQTGHGASNVQTQTIIVPEKEQTVRSHHGQSETIIIPTRTVLVPVNIPKGLQPLSLPDDFNQTIYNKFCLILQSNPANNYSLSFKGLNDYDVAGIQTNENTLFMNATEGVKENVWYQFSLDITSSGITTEITCQDGTTLQSSTAAYDATGNSSLALVLANNLDNAVIFKNLEIQSLDDHPEQTTPTPTLKGTGQVRLYPVLLLLLSGIGFFASIVLIAKLTKLQKVKNSPQNGANEN